VQLVDLKDQCNRNNLLAMSNMDGSGKIPTMVNFNISGIMNGEMFVMMDLVKKMHK